MIRMIKLVNQKPLHKQIIQEDWGKLIVLDKNVRNILSRWNTSSSDLGKDAEVKVVQTSGKELWSILNEDNILGVVIRYKQDSLILITNNYSNEFKIRELADLEDINSNITYYENRLSVPRTFKSESGCVKLCNSIIKFLASLSSVNPDEFSDIPNTTKEIASKINFQIVYKDLERNKKQAERKKLSSYKNTVNRNNISTPSNYAMESGTLKQRLKDFLENRLPNYNDISQLPKDMKLFKENTQFKLFGCVYKFEGYNSSSLKKLLLNKTGYINFENEYRYNYKDHFNEYPKDIVFEIGLNNQYQLYVKNIYFYAGSNYSYSIDELQPIEQFTAYIANIKNKSNDEE